MHGLGPGAHGLWPPFPPAISPHPYCLWYLNRTDTTYYNPVAAATVGPAIVLKLSLSPPGGGPCRALRTPRRRLRSQLAGTSLTCRSLVKTTSRCLARPASRRASFGGPSRSRRCQCPPLATACGTFRWQTRQGGHPMRGRRMARRGGASGLWSPFWHRRWQARHARHVRRR